MGNIKLGKKSSTLKVFDKIVRKSLIKKYCLTIKIMDKGNNYQWEQKIYLSRWYINNQRSEEKNISIDEQKFFQRLSDKIKADSCSFLPYFDNAISNKFIFCDSHGEAINVNKCLEYIW